MPKLTLYGYYKSSCTTRLRIALALKKIDYTTVYINFAAKEHRGDAYAAINPNQSLPTLVVEEDGENNGENDDGNGSSTGPLYITQSVAALEYLEEAFPDCAVRLLPGNAADRARVRSLVEIVVADLQPRQSAQTLEKLADDLGASQPQKVQWAHDWCIKELRAYEELAASASAGSSAGTSAGKYSVGDSLTLADVCLVPAVQNAVERWGVDLDKELPGLARIYNNLKALPEVQAAHWAQQPDAPKQ
ncbi:MAG: hypothetical protein STHCBS139747_001132 [Sporothrix thermara]